MHTINIIHTRILAFVQVGFFSDEKITTEKRNRKQKNTLGMQILLRYEAQQFELT